jgi:hypothetical protein
MDTVVISCSKVGSSSLPLQAFDSTKTCTKWAHIKEGQGDSAHTLVLTVETQKLEGFYF